MKTNHQFPSLRFFLIVTIIFSFHHLAAQQQTVAMEQRTDFWEHVQFGGGLGLSIGSGYTDISVSPSAIYNFNSIFAAGTSLQLGYVSSKNFYTSTIYGGSIIGLVNPIPEIQLSVELEEVNINTDYKNSNLYDSENFWNTSLYLGAGYRTGNVTIGARYNVLFKENKNYYNDAFMPFVRVYF